MSRSPNQEQKLAIEHKGGVSLKAGAGAGKTFVIVEHLVYLIKDFIGSNFNSIDYEKKLRDFLSQRVLMTFTNKAVGEITIRVQKRVEELCLTNPEWELVKTNLSFLNITTIHGFCFKLIRQGLIPNTPSDFELVDESIIRKKVEGLLKEWFESSSIKDESAELYQRLSLSFNQSLETILSVIMSPEIRMTWKNEKEVTNNDLRKDFFERFFSLNGIDNLYDYSFDLSNYHEESGKDWYELCNNVFEFLEKEESINTKNINSFYEILQNKGKRFPTAPKKFPEVKESLQAIKESRDILKKYIEDILAYIGDEDHTALKWINSFYDMYHYVEEHYYDDSKISFSDLEFLVASNVIRPEVSEKIYKEYEYFIVDEFQDTSLIQFQILSEIIKNNYDRIFCVGDLKQAIYGFRGGDLTVFDLCIKKTKQVLSLANNYRSKGRIIDFNNSLFENLFSKGLEFSEKKFDQVALEYQVCPTDALKQQGHIRKTVVNVISENKPRQGDFDHLEAKGLMDLINQCDSLATKEETVCVLYKNLRPSFYLIGELLKTDYDFKAQTKLTFNSDPINYITIVLLESALFANEKESNKDIANKIFFKHFYGLYALLGFDTENIDKDIFYRFCDDYSFYGLQFSLDRFIYSLGICFSELERNVSVYEQYIEISEGSLEKFYNLLNENGDISYSLMFTKKNSSTDKKCNIVIMTAHASKGLEFDNVLLGGIQRNGRSNSSSDDLFGKWPQSFRWKKEADQKQYFKSPEYILEELTQKKTEFNESMRLFYVACTRAVNTLGWVELNHEGTRLLYSQNSWVNGLYVYQDDKADKNIEVKELDIENDGDSGDEELEILPLLHIDNLGLVSRENKNLIGLISETSVTKLTDLTISPQHFYLKHILKLEDIDKKEELSYNEIIEEGELVLKSSSERGSQIHLILSETIKLGGIVPRNVDQKTKEQISWVLEKVNEYISNESELISENMLKFDVFGQMITGIPDLVILSDNATSAEIWDFKTGRESDEKNQKYFFQLNFYAFAIFRLKILKDQNAQCLLKIVYVDEKKIVEKSVNYSQAFDYVKNEWAKLAHFNQVSYH